MYANQKMIIINKQFNVSKTNNNVVFTSLNVAGIEQAISHLNASGLRVYLYILKNKDRYGFDLSVTDFMNTCRNVSKTVYYSGVKELIDQGFLIKVPNKKNLYLCSCFSQICKEQDDFYNRMHGIDTVATKDDLSENSIDQISTLVLTQIQNQENS
jgi:hypothetical protein